jgi:hypothetical protein
VQKSKAGVAYGLIPAFAETGPNYAVNGPAGKSTVKVMGKQKNIILS